MSAATKQRASHEAGRAVALGQRRERERLEREAQKALEAMRASLPKRPPRKEPSR